MSEFSNRWPRAWGEVAAGGIVRQEPGHFQVEEQLSFEPSGSGEHVLLQIRKTGENTLWIAKQLARVAGIKPRDVGYAGLKDRNAVTTQWFSVGLVGKAEPDWGQLNSSSVEVMQIQRHHRKLRTGALRGNRFRIRIADFLGDPAETADRLALIGRAGIPNYFGEQRFGHGGNNVSQALAMFAGQIRVRDRKLRGLYLSAARSWLFNEILARRVVSGNWNTMIPGEVLGLDARSAVFALESEPDEDLVRRLRALEIHPTGALWGEGETLAATDVRRLEQDVAGESPQLADGLERARLKQERRPLRTRVSDLSWEHSAASLEMRFTLCSGTYATSVLREIVRY